jgi:two-component system response regulator YesN
VAKLIEREYQRDLPVSEVAQALGISVSYLSESVRKVFGVTFVALLTSVRLRHARRALRQTEASVAQIASMVGYRDYRYFARVFRENVGRPPSEYRRSAS